MRLGGNDFTTFFIFWWAALTFGALWLLPGPTFARYFFGTGIFVVPLIALLLSAATLGIPKLIRRLWRR